jgi:iron(III) transport system substrate-binding protein
MFPTRHPSKALVPLILGVFVAACSNGGAASVTLSPTVSGSTQSAPSSSAKEAVSLESVCAAAQTEGELDYYTSIEAENEAQFASEFAKAYPGIEITWLSDRPENLLQKVITEGQAGRTNADLINGGLNNLQPLIDRGLVDEDVDWASLGVDTARVASHGTPRLYRVPLGLAYNSDTTDPKDLPSTWEAVIDQKYAGKVVVDPRGYGIGDLVTELGKEKTLDYAQRFKDVVKPILIEGGTAGMLAVAGGEATFTVYGRADSAVEQQAKGVPLAIKYLDIIPTTDFYNAVLAKAAHPNAAACFAGWLASPAGAAVYNKLEFKSNEDAPAAAPTGATLTTIETEEDAQASVDVKEAIGHILTGA